MREGATAIAFAVALGTALPVLAQSSDDVNSSNNPLTPAVTVNLQDVDVASYHELPDSDSNSFLLRGVLPHKLFGLPRILRATLPLVTSPDEPFGSTTGLGDLNLFDLALFQAGAFEIGVGPQLTLDTSTDDEVGTRTWQAGLAALVLAPQPWGLVGGLVTWQHSFAKDGGRRDQNNLQAQPLLFYNLPHGFYLRSAAIWTFDLHTGDWFIPIGAGAGKVWKLAGGTTLNLFVEPQDTVVSSGVAPRLQIFAGLNMQFPIRR
jgi:hypothetical protein